MRVVIFYLFTLLSASIFGQDNWKQEELDVLERYGLETNDPRGIVLNPSGSDCPDGAYPDIKSAIETFFTATLKKDLSTFCIAGLKEELIVGEPLDIHRIVQLYLKD
jgi:hypothetical protein